MGRNKIRNRQGRRMKLRNRRKRRSRSSSSRRLRCSYLALVTIVVGISLTSFPGLI